MLSSFVCIPNQYLKQSGNKVCFTQLYLEVTFSWQFHFPDGQFVASQPFQSLPTDGPGHG